MAEDLDMDLAQRFVIVHVSLWSPKNMFGVGHSSRFLG